MHVVVLHHARAKWAAALTRGLPVRPLALRGHSETEGADVPSNRPSRHLCRFPRWAGGGGEAQASGRAGGYTLNPNL